VLTPFLSRGYENSSIDKLEGLPTVVNFVVGVSAADSGSRDIGFTEVTIFGYLEVDKIFLSEVYYKIDSSPPS
jgi:hypothetical protein